MKDSDKSFLLHLPGVVDISDDVVLEVVVSSLTVVVGVVTVVTLVVTSVVVYSRRGRK